MIGCVIASYLGLLLDSDDQCIGQELQRLVVWGTGRSRRTRRRREGRGGGCRAHAVEEGEDQGGETLSAQGADHRLGLLFPADLEVLQAALGLGAPIDVGGHLDGAKGVGFDAGGGHRRRPSLQSRGSSRLGGQRQRAWRRSWANAIGEGPTWSPGTCSSRPPTTSPDTRSPATSAWCAASPSARAACLETWPAASSRSSAATSRSIQSWPSTLARKPST